jgi:HEAT repeat protein
VVLLGKSVGHRMHTASLLWVSPYAAALTGAAASIAASDGFGPAARDAAIYLLSRTATPANEELLRSLLRESPRVDLRNACLIALAHIGALRPEDDLRPYLCDPETRWNAIYAAGITHHPHLTEPEADSVDARWWLSVGPGFWE